MNMKKTLAGVAAGAMALSAFAVSASAAQEKKFEIINLNTEVWYATSDVDPEIYGKQVESVLEAGSYAFNFDVKYTLPSKYVESSWWNLEMKGVTNLDGKAAKLVIEGYVDEDYQEKLTKKVSLKVKDGYYVFDILEDDSIAGRNEVAADTFTKITSIAFEGTLSSLTPWTATGFYALPADANLEITKVNWKKGSDEIADFKKFAGADTYTASGAQQANLKGVALQADTEYDLETIHPNLKIRINDVIGNNKGATVTFKFLTASELTGLGWKDYWGLDIAGWLGLMNDAAPSSMAIGLNKSNTRLMQKTEEVKDNQVTFSWDELVAKSGLSAASGDVDSIHIKVKTYDSNHNVINTVYLGSIEINVPEIKDEDNTPAAGNDQPDETLATEAPATEAPATEAPATEAPVTTVATQAAPNATTGNAPIALAAIPVALAAAVLVAKKRG